MRLWLFGSKVGSSKPEDCLLILLRQDEADDSGPGLSFDIPASPEFFRGLLWRSALEFCSGGLLQSPALKLDEIYLIRYIIKTSPCIGVVSVGHISTNFFIPWSTAFASCVHCMFFLSVQLLSALKKGRDLLAPFNRNRLKDAILPLRLCMSLSVFG
nr:hypothetical protein [Tanacetum cinerariifolium]